MWLFLRDVWPQVRDDPAGGNGYPVTGIGETCFVMEDRALAPPFVVDRPRESPNQHEVIGRTNGLGKAATDEIALGALNSPETIIPESRTTYY